VVADAASAVADAASVVGAEQIEDVEEKDLEKGG
tara:strand:- start:111 stop:212 length:102 start_codon:yes stop_codon:yes gene_type:complete